MIAEFIFFMTIAAICFSGAPLYIYFPEMVLPVSGLLFTLWTLGKASWTIKVLTIGQQH
jgi:hypothetical protein